MELEMGAFALLPRNVGATRFLPSFVIVTFCCKTCGVESAHNYYQDVKGNLLEGVDGLGGGGGGIEVFGRAEVSSP